MTQQIDQCSGREARGLRVRAPLGSTEGLQISLCSRQQEQGVGGHSRCGLQLHTVGVTHLSLPETQQALLISEIELNVPAPQIALEQSLQRKGWIGTDQKSGLSIEQL